MLVPGLTDQLMTIEGAVTPSPTHVFLLLFHLPYSQWSRLTGAVVKTAESAT